MEKECPKNTQQEIDLWDLLKKSGQLIYKAFKVICKYLYRRWIWLISFLIVGIVVGFVLEILDGKYYNVNLLMTSQNVNSDIIIQQIDALDGFVQKKDTASLKRILGISTQDAVRIRKMTGLYAIDATGDKYPDYADIEEHLKKNPADTSLKRLRDYFYLSVQVYSDESPTFILNGIKNYINHDPFCKKENDYAVVQKRQLLEQNIYQLEMLDSLQKTEYLKKRELIAQGQQLVVLTEKDRNLYHRDYIELYTQILKIEKDLSLYSDVVTEMQDFPPLSIASNNLSVKIWNSVWIAFSAGLIILLFWDNRKNIKKFLK